MKTIKLSGFAWAIAGIGMLASCSSDNNTTPTPLPPIGGYNSADEVGAADLMAYWPLNGNGTESKSSTAPSTTVGTTWETGIKGQGAKLTAGYMKFPSISALTAMTGSITVSAWVKITNQKLTPTSDSAISPILSLTNPIENVGNLAFFGNTHGLVTSDSIQMKAEFKVKKPDGTTFGGDCLNMTKMESWMIDGNLTGAQHTAAANKIGGQWAQVVFRYTAANGKTICSIFSNGVKISNEEWEERKIDNASVEIPFNPFTPTYPIIGALKNVVDGTNTDTWNAALNGSVDEIRIWKKALTNADINSLYELEKAGR